MSSLFPFVGEMMPSQGVVGYPTHSQVVIVHAIGPDGAIAEQADGVIGVWQLGCYWRIRRLDTPVSEFKRVPYVPDGWHDEPPKAPPNVFTPVP